MMFELLLDDGGVAVGDGEFTAQGTEQEAITGGGNWTLVTVGAGSPLVTSVRGVIGHHVFDSMAPVLINGIRFVVLALKVRLAPSTLKSISLQYLNGHGMVVWSSSLIS
jgi:hypothetical protein